MPQGGNGNPIVKRMRTTDETRFILLDHLLKRFKLCNCKDYCFTVKNLSRELSINSYVITRNLVYLRSYNFVIISNPTSKRAVWKTQFENKTEGEIKDALI